MQNNDQKGSLKETFSEFGAAPTDGLWNAISDKLDNKKKRRFAVWWWSTGLAAVLVVGFTVWNWNQPSESQSLTGGRSYVVHYEDTPNQDNSSKGGTLTTATDSIGKKVPFTFVWDPSMLHINFPFMNGQYAFGNLYSTDFGNVGFYGDRYPRNLLLDISTSTNMVKADTNAYSVNLEELLVTPTDTIIRTPEVQQLLLSVVVRKWQIGLFAGRSMAITQSNPLIEGKESTTPSSMAINPPVETRYSWNADLTVSRLIYRRWWLGSGVHFGFMQSGTIPETSNYKSGKVNYLSFGVPISIGREFWIGGRFNITPMAGFRYDYAFRKTEEYTYQPDLVSLSSADALPEYSKTSGTAHLHLVSAFAAAEVKFRLGNDWALIAKPMAQFYVFGQTDETTPNTFRNVWLSGAIGVTKRF